MDGDRHHRKLGRPQHHHRLRRDPGQVLGQLGEILGMAGLGEARAIEHVLGDRIGDDRASRAGADVGHRATDRCDRRRCARLIGMAGSAVTATPVSTTGSAVLNAAAAPAGSTAAIGRPGAIRSARRVRNCGSART